MSLKIENQNENCISTTHPYIAQQWHFSLNGGLTPNDVQAKSTKRVWWICERGHEWKTEVRVRCERKNGCPYCAGHRAFPGENDLASQRPDLIKEWDFEANDDCRPDEVGTYSPRKVSWICIKGHKWVAGINKRTRRNQSCPYCSGRRAIPGETDIATLYPEVMLLWDFEKNAQENIYPENMKPHSDVKTWWKCKKGHSWQSATKHIVRGTRCPYCSNKEIIPGENDLKTLAPPEMLIQWDYEGNVVNPDRIALRYSKPVWWKCEKGHKWKCSPDGRLKHPPISGCPYCEGIYVTKGENDLETKSPELLDEYNYERNRSKPNEIHWGTQKKIWWKCNMCSYEWRASVASRTKGGNGCPRCRGKYR